MKSKLLIFVQLVITKSLNEMNIILYFKFEYLIAFEKENLKSQQLITLSTCIT